MIAGGGPTGLMLAGELALAGVDVAIVERRPDQDLPGSRAGGLQSRTIEVLDQRGIADRFLAEGQVAQVAGFGDDPPGHQRLPDPASLRARAVAETHRAHPRRLGRRAGGPDPLRHRGDRVRAGRRRRGRRAVRRPTACGRSTSSGATGDAAWSARRPASSSPAGMPTTSALLAEVEMTEEPELGVRRDALGHARPGQGRVRGQGRRGGLPARRDGRGHADRGAGRHQRADDGRSSRGPHRRVRDRLRDPRRHLAHPVHRHDPAGRGLPQGTGPAGRRRRPRAFPGRWSGPQHRRAGCGEPGLEAGPGGARGSRRTACSIPTTTSATRSVPACSATRWRRSRSRASTIGPRRCATAWPSCWAWTSLADDSAR